MGPLTPILWRRTAESRVTSGSRLAIVRVTPVDSTRQESKLYDDVNWRVLMTNPLRSLNHGLCDELNMLRDTTRNFVLKELAPIADEVDRSNDFQHPLWRKMGALGLLGITVDER